ncbi:MAG: D-alanine--D-alanine ligase family protein, partial [Planctomycetaceae bacterium]
MTLRIGFAYNERPSDEDEPPGSPSHDRYAEWDAPDTIAAVEAALERAGDVIRLEADAEFPGRLRDSSPDIVFNIAEGLDGPNREAHVPAICEFHGIPYTASDPLTLCLALDKRRAKEAFLARGVATPPFFVAGDGAGPLPPADFPLPAFVKPLFEGSSKGIDSGSVCHSRDAVERRV